MFNPPPMSPDKLNAINEGLSGYYSTQGLRELNAPKYKSSPPTLGGNWKRLPISPATNLESSPIKQPTVSSIPPMISEGEFDPIGATGKLPEGFQPIGDLTPKIVTKDGDWIHPRTGLTYPAQKFDPSLRLSPEQQARMEKYTSKLDPSGKVIGASKGAQELKSLQGQANEAKSPSLYGSSVDWTSRNIIESMAQKGILPVAGKALQKSVDSFHNSVSDNLLTGVNATNRVLLGPDAPQLKRNYGITQDGTDLQKKYLGTGETKRLPAGFKAIDTFTDDDGETRVKLPDGSVVAPVTVAQKAKLNPLNAREGTEGGIVFNNENGSGGGWMKFNDPEVNKKMMGKLKKGRGTVSQMTIDGDKWAGATRGNTMAAIGEAYRKGTIDSKFAREMMDQALGITPAPVDNGPELLPMPMQDGGLTPAQNARIRRQQKLVMAQNKLLSDNYNGRARNKSYDAIARAQGLRQSAADARTDRQFRYTTLKSEREAAAQAEKDRLTRESDMIKRFGSYYDSKDASTKAQAMKDFTMIIPGMADVMDGAGYQSFISELEQGDLGTIIRDYDAAVREYDSAMGKKNTVFPDLLDQIPEDRNNFILSSIRDKMMKRRKAAEANPS